jgi:MscS family membrane protein
MLSDLLDGNPEFNIGEISNSPEGNQNDNLPEDRELLFTASDGTKKVPIEMQRRKLDAEADPVWIFTQDAVAAAPAVAPVSVDSVAERYLPRWFVNWILLRTPVWRWIALILSIVLTLAISKRLARLTLRVLQPFCRRIDPRCTDAAIATFFGPVRLLLSAILFRLAIAWLPLSAVGRFYLERTVHVLMAIAFVWILSGLLDVFVQRFQTTSTSGHTSLSRSALPLLSKIAKGVLLILAITLTLANWGFDMTTVLAGVGIGGIAIALAAQKTIENLFGGIAIITDGPVNVGDFCKFGDRVGTVEDIGLRSTRVRTLDRTLVTVPNADFSSMVLENYSRRDKIWFHPVLNLRKDTTPAQVRTILQAIQRILAGHPKVEVGTQPVRFVGTGSFSLDIEIFAYIRTGDYDEFLKVQQELLLPIMDAIGAAGTALALPADTSVAGANSLEDNENRYAHQLTGRR